MLDNLLNKNGGKGLLVLKTDCLGLQASVVTGGGKTPLKITHTMHSREVDPTAALKDVLSQLKLVLGKAIPSEAVLLHINAIPSRVEITQNSDIAGDTNLAEMMRWEMDGVVADQSPMWDLAWVMLQRGYLNVAQHRKLLDLALEEKRLSARHGGRSAMRVGELAIREHMATQDQIAECLQIQEKLQLPDQRLLTQWRPLPTSEINDELGLDETAGQNAYLCSAMPIAQHLQWVNSLRKVSQSKGMPRVNLKHVYPFCGSTLALLDSHDDKVLLTEFHPAYAFCALVENGILRDTLMFKASSHPLEIDTLIDSLQANHFTDASRWVIANVDGVDMSFVEELEAQQPLRAEFLPKASDWKLSVPKDSKYNLMAELGVAAHMLGKTPLLLSPLPGMPPPAPIYKRKNFRIGLAIAAVPLLIGSYEAFRYVQMDQLQKRLSSLDTELARFGDVRGNSQEEVRQAEENITSYRKLERALNSLQYHKDLVQSVLIKRQAVVEKLLPTLSHSINDGVILDSLNETDWYQFTLTGRAVDQNSVDEFNRVLSINLQPLDIQIINSPSRLENQGTDYNYGGVYVFEFTLKKRSPT
jgi:hypothetical protein